MTKQAQGAAPRAGAAPPRRPPLTRYLVELFRPGCGWEEIQTLAARSRQATEELRRDGTLVRFLRAVFVPEDETCFLLFEAESPEATELAASRAGAEVRSVVDAISLRPPGAAKGTGDPPARPPAAGQRGEER